jgi:hypothetical protein
MLAQVQQSIPKIASLYQYTQKDRAKSNNYNTFIEKIKTLAFFQNSIEICNSEMLQSDLVLLRLNFSLETLFNTNKREAKKLEIAFEVFTKINQNFTQSADNEFFIKKIQNNRDTFKKWVHLGLKLEIAFILADLCKKSEIGISNSDFDTLNKYIKLTIEDYATLSIFLNIWKFEDEDERQLIRNIKIKSAIFSIENKETQSISFDELRNLITQN